jgi:methylisocitrate lyase
MNSLRKLRDMIAEDDIIVLPGVYDVLSAIIAEKTGFEAIFTSGFGIAATQLGMPDYGLMTATEVIYIVEKITNSIEIDVVVDIDTGYGNPLNVMRTVNELLNKGVSGIILEDQQWPKRCGHLNGKSVISVTEHVEKIKAARETAGQRDLIIVGRTDARAVIGLDEAIRRGHAYREAGADIIFIEAPQSKDELIEIGRAFSDTPLFVNMVEGGKTPILESSELKDMGYKVAVYPLTGLFASTNSIISCFDHLKKYKTTLGYRNEFGFSDFEKIIDMAKYRKMDMKFKLN